MKNSSYSVLFMRDDMDVKSFRVSPRRLKLLLWTAAALGVVVLIVLVVGIKSFVGYRSVVAERRSLELSLADAQVALERLGNIEKIQQSMGGAPASGAAKDAKGEKPQASAGRAFAKVDSGTMGVDNIRVQASGGSVSVAFDLNNKGNGAACGDIRLMLLKNDGTLVELAPTAASDLTYQITRFKHISASAPMPAGLNRREALGLRVEIINAEGVVILGETFALGG
jgi:hypothetical protein